MYSLELLIGLTELIQEGSIHFDSIDDCIDCIRERIKPLADDCDAMRAEIAGLYRKLNEQSQLNLLLDFPNGLPSQDSRVVPFEHWDQPA